MHVIKLDGYNATVENGEKLELGTFDSYGEEQLQIVKAPDWENLSVIATFNPPYKKPVQAVVDSVTGVIKVPKEATADSYGVGTIVFVGLADGVQRISSDVEYIVRRHSNASGTEPAEPTPDLLQQVLTLSKDAQTAAKNAEQSAKNAAKDAADTVKPYKEEAVRAATAAALSEKNAAESKTAAQEAAERATQAGIAASNAAEEAERSAGIATDAAGGSALNAENAHKSALAAQQSAKNAAESQSVAAASADAAAKSQQSAAIDAKTASDAKVAAAGSAEASAGSANAAENSASAAAGSEQAAGTSELKAAKSEKAAKASEQAASESAQAALESKTAAATSEVNAAASAKKAQDVADSLPEDYTTAVNDIATLKQQVANITPDDSSIGDKPWSSKHIIDMLCPPLEESGNPVVCYPVAGYPLGVKASWEPMQEGTGTPSPENIRPIKGRDSVTVNQADGLRAWKMLTLDGTEEWTVSGKFLDNKTDWYYVSSKIPDAINIQPQKGNEICSHYPHADIANNNTVQGCAIVWGSIRVRWGDTIPNDADAWKAYLAAQHAAGTPVQIAYKLGKPVVVPDTNGIFFSEQPAQGGTGNPSPDNIRPILLNNAVQVGQTNTLTLPETVYGGEVDAVSGDGQDTQKLVILNGTESWNSWGINAHNPAITGFYTYDINDYDAKNTKGICSHLETPNQDVWGGRNAGIGFATVGSSRYFMLSMLTSSLPDISAGHEVASLKAYLAAQNDAGTPVQIAYKLATPTPFTATGAQPIPALAGVNTVLTDADSATVTGRADPIKRITDLEDAVASQT